MKKIAVIAGGGALGSFTAGKLSRANKEYDIVIGTSTGALMAPLVALGKYETLSEAYLDMRKEDIFNDSPIRDNGSIKTLKAISKILRGKLTVGENVVLLKTIKKYFTEDDFKELNRRKKEVIVVVKNITCYHRRAEYINSKDYSYDKFVKFMWASASIPLVTSIINIDGEIYADGGLTENVALSHAMKFGKNHIDVFTHKLLSSDDGCNDEAPKNFIQNAKRIIGIMREEMGRDDLETLIENNELQDLQRRSKITVNYLPIMMRNEKALDFTEESQMRRFKMGRND